MAGYAFISAYLKGSEAKVVTSGHVSNMSRTPSVQDIMDGISGTDIGRYLDGVSVQTFDEMDEQLWTYLGECLRQVEWFKNIPEDISLILNAYIVKYDVLNVKAVLQSITTGKKARRIPAGIIHNGGMLDELFAAESVENIISVLNACKLGEYAGAIAEYNVEEGARARLRIEAGLDDVYYGELLRIAGKLKEGVTLSRVLGITADMLNLKIVLRSIIGEAGAEAAEYIVSGGYVISQSLAREMMPLKLNEIPERLGTAEYRAVLDEIISGYERTKSISTIDEIIDKNSFRLVREILAPRVMSPLVAVWYIIIKETEVRNLRMLMKSAFDSIAIDEVKDYLVFAQ